MKITSFVLGLVGGIINCHMGAILIITFLTKGPANPLKVQSGALALTIFVLILCILSLVGACNVLRRGTIGGVLMIVSSSLIFMSSIAGIAAYIFEFSVISLFVGIIPSAIMVIIAGILGILSRNHPHPPKKYSPAG